MCTKIGFVSANLKIDCFNLSQGKCIVDIQQFSGARIQISKKGQYSPGTRNRLVTVVGSPKSISAAK